MTNFNDWCAWWDAITVHGGELEEHNRRGREAYQLALQPPAPRPNGLSCPWCDGELLDSSPPGFLMTLNPPQCGVHCSECQYSGFRVVTEKITQAIRGDKHDPGTYR